MTNTNAGQVVCDKCRSKVFIGPETETTITALRKAMRPAGWRYCRWQGRSSDLCPVCYQEWEKGGRL